MVEPWAASDDEFVKRAAFALLWALALHDKTATDDRFLAGLRLIEREAVDNRRFVTKALAMAMRAIDHRNHELQAATAAVSHWLSSSPDQAARRVGRATRTGGSKGG